MGILPLLLFSIVLITSWHDFSSATPTLNTTIEDQTNCEMCSSCESPCHQQPVVSPPPPPPPITGADCPPPPSPLPPAESSYHPPPHGGECSHCPPPNPIIQYIPFYYYKPNSNSLQLNSHVLLYNFFTHRLIFFSLLSMNFYSRNYGHTNIIPCIDQLLFFIIPSIFKVNFQVIICKGFRNLHGPMISEKEEGKGTHLLISSIHRNCC